MAVLRNRSIPAASTRVPSAIRVLSPSLVAIRAPMLETTMISTVCGNQARPAWIGEYPRISCRYSELKKTAPIITTDTSAATELPATTDLSFSIRAGRRGLLLLFSTTTNAIKRAAERASNEHLRGGKALPGRLGHAVREGENSAGQAHRP